MKRAIFTLSVVAVLGLMGSTAIAGTVTVVKNNGTTQTTNSLTGFATTGAMMDGMSVTVVFADGSSSSKSWTDIDSDSGGVSGTDWGLREDGDTFIGTWTLTNSTTDTDKYIDKILIDAGAGNSVFDIDHTSSTAGSANGYTFAEIGSSSFNVTATYLDVVALTGDTAVGDLYRRLTIDFTSADFGASGSTATYKFRADTDNLKFAGDINPVPLPAAAWLGLGMLGALGLTRRIRRKK